MFITNDFHQLYNHTAFFSERHQPLVSKDMASNDQALWFLLRNQKAIILVYSFWVVRSKVIIFVHPSVAIIFPSYMFPFQAPLKGNIFSWGFGFFSTPWANAKQDYGSTWEMSLSLSWIANLVSHSRVPYWGLSSFLFVSSGSRGLQVKIQV